MKKGKEKREKKNNVWSNVFVYSFLAVLFAMVLLTVASKKNSDGAIDFFGVQMRIVQSSSMEKCDATDVSGYKIKDIPVKSIVFIQTVPKDGEEANRWYDSLNVGDVLTFKYVYVKQETITHRLVNITPNGRGGYFLELEGDNKSEENKTLVQKIDTSDPTFGESGNNQVGGNYVIGKVTGQSKVLGWFVYALKQPVSSFFIIIVPCFIIIVFEIVKIVSVLSEEKKQKVKSQYDEICELKRQIERLRGNNCVETDSDVPKKVPPNQNGES